MLSNAVAKPPVILQPLSSTSRVMKIGVWSKTLSQRDLSEVVMWTVRPKLMSVPGVANVAVWGQRDKQFQVLIDLSRQHDDCDPGSREIPEQRVHVVLGADVDAARRVIEQEHLGISGKRSRDHDALTLPARKFVRIPVKMLRKHVNAFQKLQHFSFALAVIGVETVYLQRFHQRIADRQSRIER